MYFKKGDTIENIHSGDQGLIMDVTSHNYADITYSVLWDNSMKPLDYQHKNIHGHWRLALPAGIGCNGISPIELSFAYGQYGDTNMVPSCQHDWKTYDSGWSRYDYCQKCNIEKTDVQ
jgi:hypothetical protein